MGFLKSGAIGTLLMVFSLQASAAIVTLYGADVSFTYDDSTLFGEGTVIGNNIFFQNTQFKAESLNGAGPVTVDDTLNIDIAVTTSGLVMTNLVLAEQGDYLMNSAGTSVDVGGVLSLSSNTTAYSDSMAFSAGALTNQSGAATPWSLNTGIELADTTGWDMDTDVTMSLYNYAMASTTSLGDHAFIEKKLEAAAVGLEVYVGPPTTVPIPAAVWLFASGLGLLGWLRRKPA